jgi:hypothetical protein
MKYLVLMLTPEHDTAADTLDGLVAQDKATGRNTIVEVAVLDLAHLSIKTKCTRS